MQDQQQPRDKQATVIDEEEREKVEEKPGEEVQNRKQTGTDSSF